MADNFYNPFSEMPAFNSPFSNRNAPLAGYEMGGPFGFSFNAPSWLGQLGMLPNLGMMFGQGFIDQMGMQNGNLFGVNTRNNYYDQLRNRTFFNQMAIARQFAGEESRRQVQDLIFSTLKAANPGADQNRLGQFQQMASDQAESIDNVISFASPMIASVPMFRKAFAGIEGGMFGAFVRPFVPRVIAQQIFQANQGYNPMAVEQAADIAKMISKDFAPIGDGLLRSRGFSTMQIGDLYSNLSLRGMTPRLDLGTRPGEAGFLQNVRMYANENNLRMDDFDKVLEDPTKLNALAKKLDKGNIDRTRNFLGEYAKALGTLADLFGPNAEISKILGHLDDITGGGLSQLTPQKLTSLSMELREVARGTQIPLPKLMEMMKQSALLGENVGIFSPTGGMLTADAANLENFFRRHRRTGGDLEIGELGQTENTQALNKNLIGVIPSDVGKRISGLLTLMRKADPDKLTMPLQKLQAAFTSNNPREQLAALRFIESGGYQQELVKSGLSTDTFIAENDVLNEANRAPSQREAGMITLQLDNINKLTKNRYRLGERIRSIYGAFGKSITTQDADDLGLTLGDEYLLSPTNALGDQKLFDILSKRLGKLNSTQRRELKNYTENLGAEYIDVLGGLRAMSPARAARLATTDIAKKAQEQRKNQLSMREFFGELTVGQQNLSDRLFDFIKNTNPTDINFIDAAKAAFGIETLQGMADPRAFYQKANSTAHEYFKGKHSEAALATLLGAQGPGETALTMSATAFIYQNEMMQAKTSAEKKQLTERYRKFVAAAEANNTGLSAMDMNETNAKFSRMRSEYYGLRTSEVSGANAYEQGKSKLSRFVSIEQQTYNSIYDEKGEIRPDIAKGLTTDQIEDLKQNRKFYQTHLNLTKDILEKYSKDPKMSYDSAIGQIRDYESAQHKYVDHRPPVAELLYIASNLKSTKGSSPTTPSSSRPVYDRTYFGKDSKFQDVLYDNMKYLSDGAIKIFTDEGQRLQALGDKLTDDQVRAYFTRVQKRIDREKARKENTIGASLGNNRVTKDLEDASGTKSLSPEKDLGAEGNSLLGDNKVATKTKIDDSVPIKVEITNLNNANITAAMQSNMGNT